MAMILAFFYIGTIPPYFLFSIFLISLIITPFYYDDKSNINRLIVSLPISKGMIIKSRYIFFVVISLCMIVFQYILMLSVPNIFEENSYYIYHWRDIIILISLTLLIISVMMPIYYWFESFILASFINIIVLMITAYFITDNLVHILQMNEEIIFNDIDPGFTLLVERYIPFQPYVTLIILSVIIFLLSMIISEKIFSRQDHS